MKSIEQFLDEMNRNGWSPVPYKHHPHHIKSAIKACGLKPAAKQCYANSQRCVALQELVELQYAEGVVLTDIGFPLQHAWIVDSEGKNHDLTLHPIPKILCMKVYNKKEVRKSLIEKREYNQIDMVWCDIMYTAVCMNLPLDLPFEEIKQLTTQTFEKIKQLTTQTLE